MAKSWRDDRRPVGFLPRLLREITENTAIVNGPTNALTEAGSSRREIARQERHPGDYVSISFITALSGLRGAGAAIDAIGNNLANLNTVGFKGSSLSFQDVVADVSGSTSRQIGSGVASPLVLK